MPTIIRQALAARIQTLPALGELLDDLREATGLTVRYLPQGIGGGDAGAGETTPLCARLWSEPAGCQLCQKFRQRLRDEAALHGAFATCDAGLWEALVPLRIGGQTAGHLLLSGCAEDTTSLAAQNRARHLLGRAGIKWNAETLAMLRAQSPLVGAKRRAAIMRLLQLAADRLAQLVTEHLVTVPSQLPAVVAQACTLVHVEYGQPLRLEALAARLAVSAGHFSRTFHHATGLRFVEYLARYRAERARLLLMEGERPVAEIARACGFCSLSQFNRVFRAVYRTSPRALRRQRSRPVATLPPGYPRGEDLSG